MDFISSFFLNLTSTAGADGIDAASVLQVLGGPVARFLLVSLALFAIYTSIKLPGSVIAEVVALLAVVALLVPPLQTGTAHWIELLLIGLGVGLIAFEIFVLPGFGIAGIAGLLMLVGGVVLTGLSPLTGETSVGVRQILIGTGSTIGAMVFGTAAWFLIGHRLARLPGFRNMVLESPVSRSGEGSTAHRAGDQPYALSDGSKVGVMQSLPELGADGIARTDLKPGGAVTFVRAGWQEFVCDVVSDRGFIAEGTAVRVVEVEGNRVVVRAREAV